MENPKRLDTQPRHSLTPADQMILVDDDLHVVAANDAARATFGEDLIGQRCFEVFEDCDHCTGSAGCVGAGRCPVRQALERGEPVADERVRLDGDHAEIMRTQAFPLPMRPGDTSRQVLMVTRPISQEKTQRATAAAGEKISAFALMAASVADELGNPLASISAQLQLAQRKDDPAFTKKALSVIDQQVTRLVGLLRDITDFSSRQSSRATLMYWNQLVEDAVRLLKHDPRGRFVAFDLDLADQLPAVLADPESSFQVLLGLGHNALDAMEGHGTVTIRTRLDGDSVVVTVRDTGPGVDPGVEHRIFEPYFSTKTASPGNGLGLFIGRRIVEQMGGTLRYLPPVDGEHSATFVLRMPVATQALMRG